MPWPSGAGKKHRRGAWSSSATAPSSRVRCRVTCRPDHGRLLVEALEASPNRLRADALLLARATGVRIGELCDLELDCVHEVPGQGAWLKVPLGKLATERMVPLDDDTVEIIDRIVALRSPGRPLRHPRDGRLVDFLLTHQGRRVAASTLRAELQRAPEDAGIGPVVPHQLRHTFATALVNAGCSLQSLMVMLGHVSAEMSLRYGRLFDATVRADYEKALALAKDRLGPVLPERAPVALNTEWREAPLIKARLAGGYCVRNVAQGTCAYANTCGTQSSSFARADGVFGQGPPHGGGRDEGHHSPQHELTGEPSAAPARQRHAGSGREL
jgi:hypothetical protein